MTALAPLSCPGCAAPVPLPRELGADDRIPCAHCGALVALSADHAAAVRASAATAAARKTIEPLWQKVTAPAGRGLVGVALLLVVLLPVASTIAASLIPYPPWGQVAIYARVTLPALFPGAALYLWSAAVAATVLRFRDAISARPPARSGAPPGCRHCGAPLTVEPEALAATCAYCGTDSLLAEVPVRSLQRKLAETVRTLDEAVRKLRARKVILGLGAAALAVTIGGAAFLLFAALGA